MRHRALGIPVEALPDHWTHCARTILADDPSAASVLDMATAQLREALRAELDGVA